MAQSHNPQSYAQAVGSGGTAQGQAQGSSQPTYDQLVNQVTTLTKQLAALQSQPPPPPPVVQVISDKIKMPTPPKFEGKMDGDSVRAFVETVDNYFDLVQLQDNNLRARFVYSLLTGPAIDWFRATGFLLHTVSWPGLRSQMLAYFQPADWERVQLQRLQKVSQGDRSVDRYINAFNVALNRCGDSVPDNIALHLFEQGLHTDIALQVYNARASDLSTAQQVAQSASLALGMAGKNSGKFIPKRELGSGSTRGSGKGRKPMEIDTVQGKPKRDKANVTCYNCKQKGHYANECPMPRQARTQGKANKLQAKQSVGEDRIQKLESSVSTLIDVVAQMAKNKQ